MLLRRVIEHVKAQNWTAVGLDFVIVVVGVFIGIQVSNWNDMRQERFRQAAYLERLADGIASDADMLDGLTKKWRREIETDAQTLRYLRNGDLNELSKWELLMAIYANGGWTSFTPDDVAYRELQNTGRLDMIADSNLRAAIGAYYATLRDYSHWYDFDTPTREVTRSLIPGPIQTYAFSHCYSEKQIRERGQGLIDCAPIFDNALIEEALVAFRAEPTFLAAVRQAQAARAIALAGSEVDTKVARELANRLKEAL